MPFTTTDLSSAIYAADVERVVTILSERDEHGIPYINLNTGFGSSGTDTAVGWVLQAATTLLAHNQLREEKDRVQQTPLEQAVSDMFQVILNIKDDQGKHVVDLNNISHSGHTLLTRLFADKFSPALRRNLLQQIIDAHTPTGDPAVNFNVTTPWMNREGNSLLILALKANDMTCLSMLLDARNADGSKAIDVNELIKSGLLNITALDYATNYTRKTTFVRSDAAAGILRAAGGKLKKELSDTEVTQKQIERDQRLKAAEEIQIQSRKKLDHFARVELEQQRARIAEARAEEARAAAAQRQQDDMQRFAGDAQSTHDPKVTTTVKSSLLALQKRYPNTLDKNYDALFTQANSAYIRNRLTEMLKPLKGIPADDPLQVQKILIEECLEQIKKTHPENLIRETAFQPHLELMERIVVLKSIRQYIASLPDINKYKKGALKSLDFIEKEATTHSMTGFTLTQVLQLVWQGIFDKSAPPPEADTIDDKYVELRKESLLEKLHDAATTYGIGDKASDQACFVGTLNKIVESLNHAHADVVIVTGGSVSASAAESVTSIIREEFKKKDLALQKEILATWDSFDTESTAAKFRDEMIPVVRNKLKEMYGVLLSEEERRAMTAQGDTVKDEKDNFYYLAAPKPHLKLAYLQEEINDAEIPKNNADLKDALLALKKQAREIYTDQTRTFEQAYEVLKATAEPILIAVKATVAPTPITPPAHEPTENRADTAPLPTYIIPPKVAATGNSISSSIKQKIIDELNSYIESRGIVHYDDQGKSVFVPTSKLRLFREDDITRQKVELALDLKEKFSKKNITTEDIKAALAIAHQTDKTIETSKKKSHWYTSSHLNKTLNKIEKLLDTPVTPRPQK